MKWRVSLTWSYFLNFHCERNKYIFILECGPLFHHEPLGSRFESLITLCFYSHLKLMIAQHHTFLVLQLRPDISASSTFQLLTLLLFHSNHFSVRTDKMTVVDSFEYPDNGDLFEREPFVVRFAAPSTREWYCKGIIFYYYFFFFFFC